MKPLLKKDFRIDTKIPLHPYIVFTNVLRLFYCIKHSFIKDAWAYTPFCASYYFYVHKPSNLIKLPLIRFNLDFSPSNAVWVAVK